MRASVSSWLACERRNPKRTILNTQSDWIATFGDPATRDNSWKTRELDGCQLGPIYLGYEYFGAPHRKSQVWMANFDVSGFELRCRRPNALAGSSHDHTRIRGRMHVDGKSFAVAEYSGKYSPEFATVYAKEVKRACGKIIRQEYMGKAKCSSFCGSAGLPCCGASIPRSGRVLGDGYHVPRIHDYAVDLYPGTLQRRRCTPSGSATTYARACTAPS